LKYSAEYIVVVVSKKVETVCCGKNGAPLELPETVGRQLSEVGGLDALIKQLPEKAAVKRTAERHQALSDPVRIRILWALSKADLCPCVLKQVSELPDSKLSYHLAVLERAGLVASRRTKNWMIYSITPNGSKELKK
jgi:ArsR family transcriptional regulator